MPSKPRRNLRTRLAPRIAGMCRYAPIPMLLAFRRPLGALLATVPGWRSGVNQTMAAALGPDAYSQTHVRDYFRHLADLIAYTAIAYRSGVEDPRLVREWTYHPEDRKQYEDVGALGKGVILVGPHLVCHEIAVGWIAREHPVTVFVRKSPDPQYEAVKQRWYQALGMHVSYRAQPKAGVEGLAEMTAALRALRKNHLLAITPDLVRKPGTGLPVQLFGRTIELPAGAFFLAQRTGSPLMPSFFHREENTYRLWTHPPMYADPEEDRDAAIVTLAQRWATLFEAFVREHPDMWQFWLDKRWKQVLGVGR
jgi:lauroyl/myristoyl acyltransferase